MTHKGTKEIATGTLTTGTSSRARALLRRDVPNVPGDTFNGTGDTGQGQPAHKGRASLSRSGGTEVGQGNPQDAGRPLGMSDPMRPPRENAALAGLLLAWCFVLGFASGVTAVLLWGVA